jgi:hypothetical protein
VSLLQWRGCSRRATFHVQEFQGLFVLLRVISTSRAFHFQDRLQIPDVNLVSGAAGIGFDFDERLE